MSSLRAAVLLFLFLIVIHGFRMLSFVLNSLIHRNVVNGKWNCAKLPKKTFQKIPAEAAKSSQVTEQHSSWILLVTNESWCLPRSKGREPYKHRDPGRHGSLGKGHPYKLALNLNKSLKKSVLVF